MAKISQLTDEMKAKLPAVADEWIKIGLQTGEIDFDLFVGAAKKCYEKAGIEWPGVVVRVSNPLTGAIAASNTMSAINESKEDLTSKAIEEIVQENIKNPKKKDRGTWHSWMGGQLWPAWAAHARALVDVCGWEPTQDVQERILAYEGTVRSACYWWPNTRFIIVCDRPAQIHRDDRGRLHHTSDKAIAWPDGWGLYCWHGVRVPEGVIVNPQGLTVKMIEDERNAEIRRVMIERYDPARYIADSGSTMVHTDDFGTIYRKEVPEDEAIVMVKVVNATPEPDGVSKIYWLRVPPEFGDGKHTARAAVAWTFNREEKEYKPWKES